MKQALECLHCMYILVETSQRVLESHSIDLITAARVVVAPLGAMLTVQIQTLLQQSIPCWLCYLSSYYYSDINSLVSKSLPVYICPKLGNKDL